MSKRSVPATCLILLVAAAGVWMPVHPASAALQTREDVILGHRMPRAGSATAARKLQRLQDGVARATALRAEGGASVTSKPPGPVLDAWVGNGFKVTTSVMGQSAPAIAADGAGGAYVVWHDFRNLTVDIFMNRLDSDGDFASGWSGLGLEVAVRDSLMLEPQIVSGSANDAYVAFTEFHLDGGSYYQDVYLQRVLGTGAIAGGWPAAGKKLSFGDIEGFLLMADGTGGTLVGWLDPAAQSRVVRIDNGGNVVSGWPATGVVVGPANATNLNATPDGTGGFYAAWATNDTILATRYAANGAVASGWSADGNVASTGGFFTDGAVVTRLTSGDLMIGFMDYRNLDVDLFAVRMAAGGGFASGWSAGGVPVCAATGALAEPVMISDGAGGANFMWVDFRSLPNFVFYAQRITAAGAVASGWAADGVAMCGPTSSKFSDAVVGDGSGGLLSAWTDDPTSSGFTDVYAQYIQSNGTRPVAYPTGGLLVCNAARGQFDAVITTDNSSGGILAWEDDRENFQPTGVFAARIRNDGTAAHASLANAVAEPGRVSLLWFSPDGAAFTATLERDAGGTGYVPIADLHADATGHIRYEDHEVEPGQTYRYRLVVNEPGGRTILGEVELRIPELLALALEPARPNPTAGPLTLAFVLPTGGPATLDLLDVTGRRVLTRVVTTAGRHVLRIDEHLAPGVYVMRLAQGGRAVSGRVVVTE